MTPLMAADVLLGEARDIRKLLLRQTPFLSDPLDVGSDQSAHIHAHRSADHEKRWLWGHNLIGQTMTMRPAGASLSSYATSALAGCALG